MSDDTPTEMRMVQYEKRLSKMEEMIGSVGSDTSELSHETKHMLEKFTELAGGMETALKNINETSAAVQKFQYTAESVEKSNNEIKLELKSIEQTQVEQDKTIFGQDIRHVAFEKGVMSSIDRLNDSFTKSDQARAEMFTALQKQLTEDNSKLRLDMDKQFTAGKTRMDGIEVTTNKVKYGSWVLYTLLGVVVAAIAVLKGLK